MLFTIRPTYVVAKPALHILHLTPPQLPPARTSTQPYNYLTLHT